VSENGNKWNKGGVFGYETTSALNTKKKWKVKWKKKKETLWLDLESPYAEYLPALYWEWAPKEPKLESAKKDNSIWEQ